jgi:small subunit ribosomal protein S21|tara:strand:- start:426 stop:617 length:192 start_codon:yes stop_codon:yes gene_type:complete
MLIIKVEKGNIEQALKRYKYKSIKIKQVKKLREKKEYTKPSAAKRTQLQKAKYVEQKHNDSNN